MKKQISSFQGLRAIAILLILFSHLASYIPCILPLGLGVNGVSVFIMLSGFCSYYAYENKWLSLPSFSDIMSYLKKKLAKFYPLHVLTFILTIPIELLLIQNTLLQTTLPECLAALAKKGLLNLLLIHSFIPSQDIYFSFNQTSWYLSDTLFFCLCTPFVLFFVQKCNTKKLFAGFGSLFILQTIITLCFYRTSYAHAFLYISPLYRVLEYVQGCLLARFFLLHPHALSDKTSCSLAEIVSSGLFLIAILLFPHVPVGINYSIFYIPFTAFLLWSFAFDGGILSHLFQLLPFRFIGNISFEIFLVHLVIFRYLALFRPWLPFLNDTLYALLAATLAIIASWLTHRFLSFLASFRGHKQSPETPAK